jgi:UDP-N-acetylmuramoyl-L-alanyl-D-glutamate--2,6-diaminopimelate ligase
MKSLIKKIIPVSLLNQYHKILAVAANYFYGRPSEKMIIIGVTGTNGKSTTVSLITKILEEAGYKVGATSTTLFKIAEKEWLNNKKMTMLGRLSLQKMLRQMVKANCQYAVIETSSQGIEQFRHLGIHYDICVFTNLTPEHIEAHGGFANYKAAKLKLFKHLERLKNKKLGNKKIEKGIVANGDEEHAKEFLDFKIKEKIIFGMNDNTQKFSIFNFQFSSSFNFLSALNIKFLSDGLSFEVNKVKFDLKLFGRFNIYNSLAAIAVAQTQKIDLQVCKEALERVGGVPGRMEFIETGKDFKVLVDYAPEPESMRQLFEAIESHGLVKQKIIHVFGSCGGGRDVARRPILGELSARNAEACIVTNEDPYDDDPRLIIEQVAAGAIRAGKTEGKNLFKILDRREAISLALKLANPGDLVLLTGKGSEQAIMIANGHKIPWDERRVVKEELNRLNNNNI